MVTDNHYRWDFIQLSTDVKPTPATSPKVADGSTLYTSDDSKLYVWYKDQWYEKTVEGGGGGTTYTAGDGIDITDNTISIDDTYVFTGTDGTADGAVGLVPAPTTSDEGKFLKADGTWDTAGGGSVTPVQTTGTSTTDVMSQNAVSSMVFADAGTDTKIKIGSGTSVDNGYGIAIGYNAVSASDSSIRIGYSYNTTGYTAYGTHAIAIGYNTKTNGYGDQISIGTASSPRGSNEVAVGAFSGSANSTAVGAVCLGAYSKATRQGEVNVGAGTSGLGYNNTAYRVIGGVHDGIDAHDVLTVGQANALIDAINSALNTNIPHIGS